jgi:hypothetical protein
MSGGNILAFRTVLARRVNFCSKGVFDTGVIGASVTSRLGIPGWATKRFWAGALVNTLRVSVSSGLALLGRFQFGDLAIGEPVGVWGAWCSEVLFIVGSVLDLIVVLRAALVDIARGVGWAFSLSPLLPGWPATVVGLPMAAGLPARVGLPVEGDLFADTLAWSAPLTGWLYAGPVNPDLFAGTLTWPAPPTAP